MVTLILHDCDGDINLMDAPVGAVFERICVPTPPGKRWKWDSNENAPDLTDVVDVWYKLDYLWKEGRRVFMAEYKEENRG